MNITIKKDKNSPYLIPRKLLDGRPTLSFILLYIFLENYLESNEVCDLSDQELISHLQFSESTLKRSLGYLTHKKIIHIRKKKKDSSGSRRISINYEVDHE